MKAIIQIPCWNEERTLPQVLKSLPRALPGFERVEWLVVDDGSTDRTVDVALENGVDHIVSLGGHRGLAEAFMAGIEGCLARGADVIVTTDADDQYRAEDIPRLLEPIERGEAQIVVGARSISDIREFSGTKKLLQSLGSWVVRRVSNTDVMDAPSGFRAITREAAMQLNVFGEFTYTLETIIQAGHKGIPITSVPIRTNPSLRPSRLIRSTPFYVFRSVATMARIFMLYRPLKTFTLIGSLPFAAGFLLGVRWLVLYFTQGPERSHVPSLVLAAILLLMGFTLWTLGMVADLQAANRCLLEDIQGHARSSKFASRDGS